MPSFGMLRNVLRLLVTASVGPSSPILVTLMMEAIRPPKRRFIQKPRGVTSQKTTFFKLYKLEISLCAERHFGIERTRNMLPKFFIKID
jgi:hypothetical protein